MNIFVFCSVFLTPGLFGNKIQKRARRDEVCSCPDPFQKVPGVPFKCLFVESWEGTAADAKNYCEDNDAILYEPESIEEIEKVSSHFSDLGGSQDRYYLGYAKKLADIACADAKGEEFFSVTSCQQRPEALYWTKPPNNAKGKEHCLEYFGRQLLNDLPCDLRHVNRIVCQFSQECPSNYKKAEGIYDKFFMVEPAKRRGTVSQAKEYCEQRSGLLYEPKSKNEMEKLDKRFPELKGKGYFVGYAKTSSEFACPGKTSDVYHGISECSDIPGAMWLDGEPDAGKECVQSVNENSIRGLVSKACDDDNEVDYIVCQFNKFCGKYTEPETEEPDDESDVTDDNSDVTDDDKSDVTDDEESDVGDYDESDVTDDEESDVNDDDKGKQNEGNKLLHVGVDVDGLGSGSFSINNNGTHSAEIKPKGR